MSDHTAIEPSRPAPALPSRLVFKTPRAALVAVAFFALCESTVALAGGWLALLYLIPVLMAVWVLRTRTVVDENRLVIRRVLGRRVVNWSDVAYLRMREGKWVAAVLTNSSQVALPAVRTMHLPVLSLITNGRVDDPTAAQAHDEPAAETTEQPTATESAETTTSAETTETTGTTAEPPVASEDTADASADKS
ncbi:MAG TPA: PH domain-containing protein [Pseudonocardiaceae bacterium]|nr:PH domain-containing protein [Pseudonocardiaceae bacterium]